LAGFEVTLHHPEAQCDAQGMLVIGKQRLNPHRTTCIESSTLVFGDAGDSPVAFHATVQHAT
jgi:hypothetical protein